MNPLLVAQLVLGGVIMSGPRGPAVDPVAATVPSSRAVPEVMPSSRVVHEAMPSSRAVHEVTVRIGDVRIRALCTDGARDVLVMHGEVGGADAWRAVLDRLDGRTGACVYDRRGTGRSGPEPGERGWYELIDELRHIHRALGFERGYLLVGQGLGGLYARLYAMDRPSEVAALLLLDPAHESLPARMEASMPEPEWTAWLDRRRRPNPDGVVEEALGARARRGRLPRIPVTVVTASIRPAGPGWNERIAQEAARELHQRILRGVEMPRHIPASGSGPEIHVDDARLVVDEVMRLHRLLR